LRYVTSLSADCVYLWIYYSIREGVFREGVIRRKTTWRRRHQLGWWGKTAL